MHKDNFEIMYYPLKWHLSDDEYLSIYRGIIHTAIVMTFSDPINRNEICHVDFKKDDYSIMNYNNEYTHYNNYTEFLVRINKILKEDYQISERTVIEILDKFTKCIEEEKIQNDIQ